MTLLFLDTETTGLEDHHQVWEMGWASLDGPVRSAFVPHSTVGADPKALEMTRYYRRGGDLRRNWNIFAEHELFDLLTPTTTIIAANPAFDKDKLQRRWGVFPAHYRMLDIESWATALIDSSLPPMSMNNLYKHVGQLTELSEPDHSAGGDVTTMREIYHYFTRGTR